MSLRRSLSTRRTLTLLVPSVGPSCPPAEPLTPAPLPQTGRGKEEEAASGRGENAIAVLGARGKKKPAPLPGVPAGRPEAFPFGKSQTAQIGSLRHPRLRFRGEGKKKKLRAGEGKTRLRCGGEARVLICFGCGRTPRRIGNWKLGIAKRTRLLGL
jgi:hypothetical protein